MATIYICKCGRRVRKSTNADNTGNRDTENCKGCPYLLPWGPTQWDATRHAMVTDVKGYECRMSKDIEYATRFCGSIDDKCSCYIASLDFDFLTRVSNWIKETYPGGELNGSFFTDDIRAVEYSSDGRYRMSIGCAQNKKGIAAKAALLHQFFDESGARLDKTREEEKAIVLAAIEAGKAKENRKEDIMQAYINQFETVFAVRNHKGVPALMCRAKDSTQWVMSGTLAAVKGDAETIGELQEVLNKAAQEYGWKPVEGDAQFENPTYSAAATAAAEETAATPEQLDSPTGVAAENALAGADGLTAFDYSGLDDQTVADLHLAEREYSSGKKMAEMGLRRMADAVAIAHGALCGGCDNLSQAHNNQYSKDTFGAWCESIGIHRKAAERLLQVSKLMDSSTPREEKVLEELSPSLLYAAAKPSAPAELVQAVKDGDITTHKQFKELEAQLKAVQTERDEARKAKEKAEQERDAARDAQAASSRLTNMITNQRDEAQIRAERAELRAKAAEEDAAGWKQAGLEMQEIVDQRDERIRELESGITVEAATVDQEEIERRANELSEPLVKIIDQQNAQIERMASGNTVAAQASVLEQYLGTMKASLLSNASRVELACYDVRALDSLAEALREFADSIDEIFEDRSEDND